MSEREIRNIVRAVCADLDERARRAAQARIRKVVLPAALGVTLAVAGCASESNSHKGPLQNADSGNDAQVVDAGGREASEPDAGPVAEYAAPLPDAGMVALYSAPLPDSGPMPPYMAIIPDASADGGPVQVDAGPVAEYMAVIPDAGPQVLYMAVVVDSGAQLLYAAPMPNK